jgi:thiaminase
MLSCVSEKDRKVSFATLLLLLWGIEKCYYEAFLAVKESKHFPELDESVKNFVEWWTTSEFCCYIDKLESVFQEVREDETAWDWTAAGGIFKIMLIYEKQFWNSTSSLE